MGLAKNTGKTVTLIVLLQELGAAGRTVGVTSVGRDGEEHDVIDSRIEKPRVRLLSGSLVATTDDLLRASGIPHELLERTAVRTPLGRVLIARLRGSGAIEVAGPAAAADVRMVSDAMLAHGADQVLIDGAIDRRAASSPEVSDGLVIATGAILSRDPAEVVARTRDAVELVRLAEVGRGGDDGLALRAVAGRSLLLAQDREPVELEPRFVLTSDAAAIGRLLDASPEARRLTVAGALPESFLDGLLLALRQRRRELAVVVADPTRAFLTRHGPGWYAAQGVQIEVLSEISLRAVTVNPVAPRSHTLDSAELRALLRAAIPGVPIFDVLHPEYRGAPR